MDVVPFCGGTDAIGTTLVTPSFICGWTTTCATVAALYTAGGLTDGFPAVCTAIVWPAPALAGEDIAMVTDMGVPSELL